MPSAGTTVRGIAASSAAILVAFLVAVSAPGAAAQPRLAHAHLSSVQATDHVPASPPRLIGSVTSPDDSTVTTAHGDGPVAGLAVVAALALLTALAVSGLGQQRAAGRRWTLEAGRAPPEPVLTPEPESRPSESTS